VIPHTDSFRAPLTYTSTYGGVPVFFPLEIDEMQT
jgi:hypothetical protein